MKIIFKGKRLDNKEWVYGDLYQLSNGRKYIVKMNSGYLPNDIYEVDIETIGQYIGLNDKNNKEIYTNDICIFSIGNELKYKTIKSLLYIIEYKNLSFGFKPLYPEHVHKDDRKWKPFWSDYFDKLWNNEYFTVIGNCCDNLDLSNFETSKQQNVQDLKSK